MVPFVRVFFCLVSFLMMAASVAGAKPPAKNNDCPPKKVVPIETVQSQPRPSIVEVEVNSIPLWKAKWTGQMPKTGKAPVCGAGTTVTFVVPSNLPNKWSEARFYKWLRSLAEVMQSGDAEPELAEWQLGRTALNPRQVTVYCIPERGPSGADNPVFGWSVGTQLAYTDAATDGGPRAIGWEFAASLNLRILDWLWFRMEFSPGYAWGVDGEEAGSWSISEFPALEFRLQHVILLAGIRHRVAFNAESDNFNSLTAEIAARTYVWRGLQLGMALGLGGAWFPIYESVDRAQLPYWVDVPPLTVTASSGFTWSLAFVGNWQF